MWADLWRGGGGGGWGMTGRYHNGESRSWCCFGTVFCCDVVLFERVTVLFV
jgi:hypothetical protein